MTEEVNQENKAAEPTPNETEARSAGWVPKDEYHGDENKWVDADEFVRRGPLFDKINVQSRELKEVKKALDALKAHHANVKEDALKDAMAKLKAEKKAAFIDGDPDKILEVEEQLDAAKEQYQKHLQTRATEVAAEVQAEVIHPEFQAWTNRNPWYTTNAPMKAFADARGVELRTQGMSPSEILKKVELEIKEEFPHKFRNPNRDKAGAVEGTSKGSGKSHSDSFALTDTERQVMNRFVRQGVMSEEQYKAELKKSKERV